jgi:hypothetical protein
MLRSAPVFPVNPDFFERFFPLLSPFQKIPKFGPWPAFGFCLEIKSKIDYKRRKKQQEV